MFFAIFAKNSKIQNGHHFWWDKNFFQNWDNHSTEIPCGSKISSKSFYLARFLRYKHFCVLQFLQNFENSKWPPFWVRQNFFENWENYSAEIACGSKISSKSLYLARFSRYKHFCVFLIWKIRNDTRPFLNQSMPKSNDFQILIDLMYLPSFRWIDKIPFKLSSGQASPSKKDIFGHVTSLIGWNVTAAYSKKSPKATA